MKKTIELLDEQHAALVQVIQFLDRQDTATTPVREVVDKILNHSEELTMHEENKERF